MVRSENRTRGKIPSVQMKEKFLLRPLRDEELHREYKQKKKLLSWHCVKYDDLNVLVTRAFFLLLLFSHAT